MAKGGKRTGAGRKPGSRNQKTRLLAEQARERGAGVTPLDVMLENITFYREEAVALVQKITGAELTKEAALGALKTIMGLRDAAQGAARDAAPYMHPRLQAVAFEKTDDLTATIRKLADLERRDAGASAPGQVEGQPAPVRDGGAGGKP